jgi:hypothetical protein
MSTRFAVVQIANGQRTILSVIDGPNAERRAKDYAKQILAVDKGTVEVEPYQVGNGPEDKSSIPKRLPALTSAQMATLEAGLASVHAGRLHDRGSFAQYANDTFFPTYTVLKEIERDLGRSSVSPEVQEIACRWWSGWTAWCVTRDKIRELAETEPKLAYSARQDLIKEFTDSHHTIILNGQYLVVPKEKPLTYEQLCQVAQIPVSRNPSMTYRRRTVNGVKNHDQGILSAGQSIDSKDLVVNVTVTGYA